MDYESTTHLMNILKETEKDGIDDFGEEYLKKLPYDFVTYISEIIEKKGLKRKDIFQKADIPHKYGYKLLNEESHTINRDYLLRIFISMEMTLKETNRALALYGFPSLYPKLKRDVVLIIAINKEIFSVDEVNEWLAENEEPELKRCTEQE